MKSRLEIIEEIFEKYRTLSLVDKEALLRNALFAMQDAMLFQAAEDLGIKIVKDLEVLP